MVGVQERHLKPLGDQHPVPTMVIPVQRHPYTFPRPFTTRPPTQSFLLWFLSHQPDPFRIYPSTPTLPQPLYLDPDTLVFP